ncbi:glucokinase [Mucilaginibacter mallensis]|uniref:Glucokinase n=1 Tax=Mucilaginibacter mallensis TaxID=652787 RepID=A0A1H1XFN4_MUCMA|nr:ROK family protein [Mucilaginibacter mallensis]SDT08085.1 glucokinase [Mucilaginibacter mallensis]
MSTTTIIGIDLGATNIRGALVTDELHSDIVSRRIKSDGTQEEVLEDVFWVVDQLIDSTVKAIGIGVPSVVDVAEGIVYDVQHIPSWKEVHLKSIMEARYKIPVYVNNDANCFALGEFYFGKGKGSESLTGLTLGTGLGAGIITNGKLYSGYNCGAGEIGCISYLDENLEFYCSGSFFQNVHQLDGLKVYEAAQKGEEQALKLYDELGKHIGEAIKITMYAYDPQVIIMGGSVSQAYGYFHEAMWAQLKTFAYQKSVERIRIEISELENSGVLGAAALFYDAGK